MKSSPKTNFFVFSSVFLTLFIFAAFSKVYAATPPDLGQAASFSILSSTYTNTVGGTTINGDIGYTTGPQVAPTVNGITFIGPSSKYTTAGTDQGSALSDINSQPCTSLGVGAVALDNVEGHPTGEYIPGCYSSGGAMDITLNTTVTLNGEGTYIFKPHGALTTGGGSKVVLTNGASACDVFWAPTAATSLGATSTFIGTDIDASGITIGSTVTWTGRALAYGGTVSTDVDTITSTTCTAATAPTPTSTPGPSSGSSSDNGIKVHPTVSSSIVPPVIIESRRVDSDSIYLSWGPYSGISTFIVQYGLENGRWLYSTNVTGFSTTINALPANQPIWVRIAARNEWMIGIYGESRLIGGPGLPNTGFAPNENAISWYVPTSQNSVSSCQATEENSLGFPTRLVIPSIGVNADIRNLGVTFSGEMEVPNSIVDVGWFKFGVRPGEKGSAVIAGHLNGKNGENGVFANLDKLKEGDKLYVLDDKGESTSFVVRKSQTYDPGYAEDVFSLNDVSHLNLVTCDGVWDSAKKSYSKRLVVFTDIQKS